MTTSRDISRIVGVVGKAGRELLLQPGIEVGVSIYNAGLPNDRQITCINDIEHSQLPAYMFAQPLAWPGVLVASVVGGIVVTFSDTVQSGASFFGLVYNAGLPENEKFQGSDERHLARIIGIQAWPGIVIGTAAAGLVNITMDTFRSLGNTFASVYNAGTPVEYKIEIIPDLDADPRHALRRYGSGLLGVLTGGLLALISTSLVDTIRSTTSTFTTVYNAGLQQDDKITCMHDLNTDTRHDVKKYGAGLIGVLAGGIAGATTTTMVDTVRSFGNTFVSIYNAGLSDTDKITCINNLENDTRGDGRKYGFGILGILVGGVAGTVAAVFTDTFRSLGNTFASVYNAGLSDTDKITCINNLENDTRGNGRKYGFGILGILVGGVAGTVAAVFTDTFRSLGNTFASVYNAGLSDRDKITCINHLENDTRGDGRKYGFGILGILVGGVAGTVAAVFTDTFRSLGNTFASVYNAGLSDADKITCINHLENDTRGDGRKYGFGILGILVGGVAGTVAATFTDTFRSLGNTFASVYNAGLSDQEKITYINHLENDTRGDGRKYGFGILGVLVGGVAGTVAATFTDTFRSLGNTFASVYNAGLSDTDKITCINNLENDTRADGRKYGFGILGILVGGVAGTVAATFTDTFRSLGNTFASVYNAGLSDTDKITCINHLENDTRGDGRKYGFGILGILVGGVAGTVAAVFTDTFRSLSNTFASVYNAGLSDQEKITCINNLENDTRGDGRKYGFGILGVLVGGVAGTVAATFTDTFRSLSNTFASVYNAGLSDTDKITCINNLENDTRGDGRKYGFGILGVLVGGVAGTVAATFTDTFRSLGNTFASVYNAGLSDTDKITCINNLENDTRGDGRKYGFGILGILVGGVAGTVAAVFTDTFRSLSNTFASVYNGGLSDTDKITYINDLSQDTRSPIRKYGSGLLGVLTGSALGAVTSVIVDSIRSFGNTVSSIYNVGLQSSEKITCMSDFANDTRPNSRKYGSGLLGVLSGGIVGAFSTFIVDTLRSTSSAFISVYNAGLTDDAHTHEVKNYRPDTTNYGAIPATSNVQNTDKITCMNDLQQDLRHDGKKYGIGLLGVFAGGVLGVIATLAVDTMRSFSNTFVSVYNSGLVNIEKIASLKDLNEDGRNSLRKYGTGFLGVLIGGMAGTVAATFTDTFRSLSNTFASVYNAGLSDADKITCINNLENDTRADGRKYGFGILGILVGGVAGTVAATFTDTFRSLGNTFASVYNAGLSDADKITCINNLENDTRADGRKYGFGIVGVLVGGVAGTVAATFTDTFRSLGNTFASVYNAGLSDTDKITCINNLENDTRANSRKYGFGILGVLVGGMAGTVAATFTDTFRSLSNTFASVYNAGLSDTDKITCINNLENDTRANSRKYGFGILGVLVGGMAGTVAATFTDTFRSLGNTFASVYNVGLSDTDKITYINDLSQDTRSPARKYASGLLGILTGGVFGAIATFAVDTARSFTNAFTSVYNAGLQPEDTISCMNDLKHDTRQDVKKYGVGALGVMAGSILGGVSTAIADSVQSASGTFVSLVNKALPDDYQMTQFRGITEDNRHPVKKYGSGLLGVVAGGIAGCIVGASIGCGRFIKNVASSWKSLSGSIMNVALERPIFNGVASEEPTCNWLQKAAQGVGYGIAALTTGILGVATYLTRKIPDIAITTIAAAASPITASVKAAASLCCLTPRFPTITDQQAIEQGFKEIFSSLDGMGQLPVGQVIAKGTDGSKSGWSVLRKCLTLNSKTPTELILDELLKSFRTYAVNHENPMAFFRSEEFAQAVELEKQKYIRDCFLSRDQINSFTQEIDDVAKFVKKYITGEKDIVRQDFYSRRSMTWNTLFFNRQPQQPILPQVEMENVPDGYAYS